MPVTTMLAFAAAFASLAAATHLHTSGRGRWQGYALFGVGLLLLGYSKLREATEASWAGELAWVGVALMIAGNWIFWQERKTRLGTGDRS